MTRHWPEITCVALAAVVSLWGSRHYADGFNDGSRFATIESLGERGTFCIDDSLFVRPYLHPERPNPYHSEGVRQAGTLDMVRIRGRYYSDKPPVPALLVGALYRAWHECGGTPAREKLGRFCFWCTVLSAGVPFALAVFAMGRLARDLDFAPVARLLFALAFGGGTLALVYTRQLNGHIQLLGAAAVVCWQLARSAEDPSRRRILLLGTFAGLGCTLDLGMGPILLALVLLAVAEATRSLNRLALAAGGAAPWLALHFTINYALGGTLRPLGSIMEYLDYPGTAFGPHNATGNWKHGNARDFAEYAAALLVGDTGFLRFNPALWLALAAIPRLLLGPGGAHRPAGIVACGWPLLSWLLYSATSNNYSGGCCSIRWFVPLLAPGFWVLGILLKESSRFRPDFLWLSAVGATIMWGTFDLGPWNPRSSDDFWPILALGGAGWLAIRLFDARLPMRFQSLRRGSR